MARLTPRIQPRTQVWISTQALSAIALAALLLLSSNVHAQDRSQDLLGESSQQGELIAQASEPRPSRRQTLKPTRQSRTRAKTSAPTESTASGAPAIERVANVKPVVAGAPIGATVTEIEIRGNKKIETDAIRARLKTKEGGGYSREQIRQDVDNLFRTGFFYDVRVERLAGPNGGARLVYTVVEKPSVTEIVFTGNDEINTDELKDATGLKSFEVLNMAKLKDSVEKMQKLYEDKGYFLARINQRIEPLGDGESVRIVFDIKENAKVKVKRITILGNKHLSDNKLKRMMATQEGGFFSFVSDSGAYKQDAFERDVQLLNYLYFSEGYVKVKIDRPQVYVTPDKKGIYITIRVEEGDRYRVGNIDFAGDLLFDKDELYKSVEIDGKEWYAHETLLKDIRELQAKYGDLGYAYANPIPRTQTRDAEKKVDITFEIDKGNKVYFGRINVVGNTKTRDKVVRRELQIKEGELYNETRRRESLANVQRLGYFDEVNFNNSTPADNPDVMNIDIVVKERNTGTIQIGAGYSTYSKFIFQGQVNQINLFGRGQKLGLSIDLSKDQSLFNLNFTEPNFLDTDWTLGADAYQSRRTTPEYRETKKGGALRVGHPLGPFLRGYLRYKLDDTDISNESDPDLFPVSTANGLTSSMTATLEYDKRNDRFAPTDGIYSSLSLEYAGLGGDKRYTIGRGTARYYKKVVWEFVFRNNLTYSFISSNNNNAPPFNELFLLGGANSLRGYDWYSIGRRKFSNRTYQELLNEGVSPADASVRALRPFGGTQQVYYNAEIEFPMISEAGIKGVVFFDIGDANDRLTFGDLRSDVGFGFRWFSPIGPLRFEWGFPIDRRPEESAMNFQFAIGSPF